MSETGGVSLLPFCEWLARSALGTALRASRWAFALTEVVHLLALAVLGGGVLALALRAAGAILRQRPLHAVVRDFTPWIAAGLSGLVVSGAVLFADGPLRYYANAAFRTKLALLSAGLLLGAAALRMSRLAAPAEPAPAGLRVVVCCDAALWLGVAIAGRVVGVL